MGRAIGLFTRGIPAESSLPRFRPGAVSGQLSYLDGILNMLSEPSSPHDCIPLGDVYRQNIATLLSAALTKAAIWVKYQLRQELGCTDLLRQVPPHIRR
jgi:hypothetical protein